MRACVNEYEYPIRVCAYYNMYYIRISRARTYVAIRVGNLLCVYVRSYLHVLVLSYYVEWRGGRRYATLPTPPVPATRLAYFVRIAVL